MYTANQDAPAGRPAAHRTDSGQHAIKMTNSPNETISTEHLDEQSNQSTVNASTSSSPNSVCGPEEEPIDLDELKAVFEEVQLVPIKLREAVGEAQLRLMVVNLGEQVDNNNAIVANAFNQLNEKVNQLIVACSQLKQMLARSSVRTADQLCTPAVVCPRVSKEVEIHGVATTVSFYQLQYSEFKCRETWKEAKKLKLNLLFIWLLKKRFSDEELSAKSDDPNASTMRLACDELIDFSILLHNEALKSANSSSLLSKGIPLPIGSLKFPSLNPML